MNTFNTWYFVGTICTGLGSFLFGCWLTSKIYNMKFTFTTYKIKKKVRDDITEG